MRELAVVRALRPLRERFPWTVPLIVVIGIVAALSEGIGLSLFLPLLYSLDTAFGPTGDNVLGGFLQRLLDGVSTSDRLLIVAFVILALALVKNVLVYANDVLYGWVDSRLAHDLRSRVAKQLLAVGIEYVDRKDAGKLLNTLQTQTWETSSALSVQADILVRLGTICIFTALLFLISWKLTLGVMLGLGMISLIARLMSRRVERLSYRGVRAWDVLSQRCLELLQRIRTVHVFGRAEYEQSRFDMASRQASRVYFELDVLSSLVRPISEILAVGLLVAVLVSLRSLANLPTVLTFIFILYRLRPQVQGLDGARIRLLALAAPVEVVMSFLEPGDKPYRPSGPVMFSGLRDAIRFDRVTFQYSGSTTPALQDVSVSFPKGKTTAVVGQSGAGKSTLIDLLVGLYEPQTGHISVDGVPLGQLDLASWRRRLAVARQDAQLFSATVGQNIAYGNLDASKEQIARAAKLAGADAFIREMPEAYETQVGDQGVRLSEGQKQRIALARALIRDSDILILDEATNAVDSETVLRVQEALDALDDERTVILISHRLSTVMRADRFIVMENGRMREQGERQQLLKQGGVLAKLYADQLGDESESDEATSAVRGKVI